MTAAPDTRRFAEAAPENLAHLHPGCPLNLLACRSFHPLADCEHRDQRRHADDDAESERIVRRGFSRRFASAIPSDSTSRGPMRGEVELS
jgi:hypothetical protein